MNRKDGIKEIDEAQWTKDIYGVMNLYVHTAEDRLVHCWVMLRPVYCDRGHMQLIIDGPLNLDGADSFPRFFFSFEEADKHTRLFLKWRIWKERMFPHEI